MRSPIRPIPLQSIQRRFRQMRVEFDVRDRVVRCRCKVHSIRTAPTRRSARVAALASRMDAANSIGLTPICPRYAKPNRRAFVLVAHPRSVARPIGISASTIESAAQSLNRSRVQRTRPMAKRVHRPAHNRSDHRFHVRAQCELRIDERTA